MKQVLSVYLPNLRSELMSRKLTSEQNTEEPPTPEVESIMIREALGKFAHWAYRFSPIVATDLPPRGGTFLPDDPRFFGINLDVTGSERLFHGTAQIVRRIRAALERSGNTVALTIAPTLGSAWALSRYSSEPTKEEGIKSNELHTYLDPLPIEALRLSDKVVTGLKEMNVIRIEDLRALPASTVRNRFGAEPVTRLDQALGREKELLVPIHPITPPRFEASFPAPITHMRGLEKAAYHLLERLTAVLNVRQERVSQLILELQPYRAQNIARAIHLTVPSSNAKHLWSLLRTQLESICGATHAVTNDGVERIVLCAAKNERFRPKQTTHVPEITKEEEKEMAKTKTKERFVPERSAEYGEFIDTLMAQLGQRNVLQLEKQESHIPERAFRFVPVKHYDHRERRSSRTTLKNKPLYSTPSRPSAIFNRAQPIKAMAVLPDGPPFWLKWREEILPVRSALGPERIAPEWWKHSRNDPGNHFTRDYFQVQLESGTWLWVYREIETSMWFVQGLWA